MPGRSRWIRPAGDRVRLSFLLALVLSLTLALRGDGFGEGADKPVTGDWLLNHSLSDPEQLNPLTSNDASASEVLTYIFEALLQLDPRTLELKPLLAAARASPTVARSPVRMCSSA